jgi:F-type H+-transporting ATPase subunit b
LSKVQVQVEQTLEEARTQARDILNRAHQEATADTAEVLAKARADSEVLVEHARTEIGAERDRAIQDLRAQVANMVISAAEGVLGSAIDDKTHQRLIDGALQKVGDNPGAKADQN